MDKETLEKIRQIEYIQNECLKEIIYIRESNIIDADRLKFLWDEFYQMEELKKMLLIKQKYIDKYLITYDEENEFIRIDVNPKLKYEESIDFVGIYINVDKNLNIISIEYERGDLDKFFNSLNKEQLQILFHICNNIIENVKILKNIER